MVDNLVPKEFFTLQSMLTLSGATGATFVIANGIQRAFDYNPKWLALCVAQLVMLVSAFFAGGSGSDYFVAIVNGFLVYCTAAGATVALGPGTAAPTARAAHEATVPALGRRRTFLSSWF